MPPVNDTYRGVGNIAARRRTMLHSANNEQEDAIDSMRFHKMQLQEMYEVHTKELDSLKEELSTLKSELQSSKAMVDFMNVEAMHGRKTWNRKVAEFLMEYKWYYPEKDNKDVSLVKAWEYYEHNTLPRHFCDTQAKRSTNLERASPGEYARDTKLYSPWTTPHEELADFGIGVGLYFSTARALGWIVFIAGWINFSLAVFYASDDYSDYKKQDETWHNAIESSYAWNASAVCSRTSWVACPNCTSELWDKAGNRFAIGFYNNLDENLSDLNEWDGNNNHNGEDADLNPINFVLKNDCPDMGFDRGMVLWFSVVFVMACMAAMNKYMQAAETRYDEGAQTAQDYSIMVDNPPPDAFDPKEWRRYFIKLTGKRVTMVTIVLNNHKLINALLDRRKCLQSLRTIVLETKKKELRKAEKHEKIQMPHLDIIKRPNQVLREAKSVGEDELKVKKWNTKAIRYCKKLLRIDTLFLVQKTLNLVQEIRKLQERDYEVLKVIVTFEQEEGQRAAFSRLSMGAVQQLSEMNKDEDEETIPKIRGKLPFLSEPSEPGAVLWKSLGKGGMTRYIFYFLHINLVSTIVGVLGFIIYQVTYSSFFAAFLIAMSNILCPFIISAIHNTETHNDERSDHLWRFIKTVLFKIGMTVAIHTVLPSMSYLEEGDGSLLITVYYVFTAELLIPNVVRILDIRSFINHHILAPRAISQDQMNAYFRGVSHSVIDSYSDLLKILTMTFIYSSLFPTGFFFCTLVILTYYYSDKYCLMRSWGPSPEVGTHIAEFTRNYLYPLIISVFAVGTSYFIAGFPYDNVCVRREGLINSGSYGVRLSNGNTINTMIYDNTPIYDYCDHNSWTSGIVPAQISEPDDLENPISDDQRDLVTVFAVTSVIVVVFYVFWYILLAVFNLTKSLVKGAYEPPGQVQNIDFSAVNEIFGYVPQIKLAEFDHPLLLCDVDEVDHDLIGYDMRNESYDRYNIIYDVPYEGMKRNHFENSYVETESGEKKVAKPVSAGDGNGRGRTTPIFAIVKQWPPSWTQNVET